MEHRGSLSLAAVWGRLFRAGVTSCPWCHSAISSRSASFCFTILSIEAFIMLFSSSQKHLFMCRHHVFFSRRKRGNCCAWAKAFFWWSLSFLFFIFKCVFCCWYYRYLSLPPPPPSPHVFTTLLPVSMYYAYNNISSLFIYFFRKWGSSILPGASAYISLPWAGSHGLTGCQ